MYYYYYYCGPVVKVPVIAIHCHGFQHILYPVLSREGSLWIVLFLSFNLHTGTMLCSSPLISTQVRCSVARGDAEAVLCTALLSAAQVCRFVSVARGCVSVHWVVFYHADLITLYSHELLMCN